MDIETYKAIEKEEKRSMKEEAKENLKGIWYSGTSIIGNFNLYEIELSDEDADFTDSDIKNRILSDFRNGYEKTIKEILKANGLKLIDMRYYSPSYYNFEGDAIDLKIKITNKKKLIDFINEHRQEIQKFLDRNHSYDGYISLTATDVNEIIRNIYNKNDLDISVLSVMFRDFRDNILTEDRIIDLIYNNI